MLDMLPVHHHRRPTNMVISSLLPQEQRLQSACLPNFHGTTAHIGAKAGDSSARLGELSNATKGGPYLGRDVVAVGKPRVKEAARVGGQELHRKVHAGRLTPCRFT